MAQYLYDKSKCIMHVTVQHSIKIVNILRTDCIDLCWWHVGICMPTMAIGRIHGSADVL